MTIVAVPAHAQDDESGGATELCALNDPRLGSGSGLTAAPDGNGWWILPDRNNQTTGMAILKVGEDCNVDQNESMFIEHQPIDPQALAVGPDDLLWAADTGGATDRDSISVTYATPGDSSTASMYRFVFPNSAEETNAFVVQSDGNPIFFGAGEGEANLFTPSADLAEYDTPLENAGSVELPEGGAVTGAALNADGSKVVLRTADSAYEWSVEEGDVVGALTGGAPAVTPIEDEGGPQGIAYDADGNFVTLATQDNQDPYGTLTQYTPAAPAADDGGGEGEDEAAGDEAAAEDDQSFADWAIANIDTVIKLLAGIAVVGMLVMIGGIVAIRKAKRRNGNDDEDAPLGFAREESGFGDDKDDPVDLGLDAGQPDPDLGQVARGSGGGQVYGAAAPAEPSGNVYGAARPVPPAAPPPPPAPPAEPSGNVYGAARPAPSAEPSGNVYGAAPRQESSGTVFGGAQPPARSEPQYGAFEGGGHGSVYDDGAKGASFAVEPPAPAPPPPPAPSAYGTPRESTGSVYGAGGARPEPTGSVYGSGAQPAAPGGAYPPARGDANPPAPGGGRQYGSGASERTPESDDDYWGPPGSAPGSGTAYGRGR
ncbi:hypothetical protein [Glycomyces buryatensis]|uniref:Uncharacterized protein n=1 Tax=Glycomyces buryatensis TaxID=2570927 RepID=A0A4S8QDM4_9ACTN|nr:hypothetical protein [Glycomyces buryatensis]THV42677.1 hypothetical protein FAB82_05800 [Glycomyces buryatensis]